MYDQKTMRRHSHEHEFDLMASGQAPVMLEFKQAVNTAARQGKIVPHHQYDVVFPANSKYISGPHFYDREMSSDERVRLTKMGATIEYIKYIPEQTEFENCGPHLHKGFDTRVGFGEMLPTRFHK